MSAPAENLLLRRREGAVEYLKLNRPRAGNSLSRAMISALHEALDELADDADVNVIVLEASGARVSALVTISPNSTRMTMPSFMPRCRWNAAQ